jgi:hypothetical protein
VGSYREETRLEALAFARVMARVLVTGTGLLRPGLLAKSVALAGFVAAIGTMTDLPELQVGSCRP